MGVAAASHEEVLRLVDFLFSSEGALVEHCVEVLDKARVVEVKARASGRTVWLVQGSGGAPYLCLRQYCSCRSFQELIKKNPQPVLVREPTTAEGLGKYVLFDDSTVNNLTLFLSNTFVQPLSKCSMCTDVLMRWVRVLIQDTQEASALKHHIQCYTSSAFFSLATLPLTYFFYQACIPTFRPAEVSTHKVN
ncbi:unnamed protein product [Choristocarpus tenellus]